MLTSSLIKKIKSLKDKKERLAQKLFVAEGEKCVLELIQSSFIIESIYGVEEWIRSLDAVTLKKAEQKIVTISHKELERISMLTSPNKVVAVAHLPGEERELVWENEPVLAFDNIQDPGNLGSIIRIADWFGIKNIVCSKNSVDAFNAKVVQGTMGSLFRVNVFYKELDVFLKQAQADQNVQVFVTALNGESVYGIDKPTASVIVFGNESKGVSELIATTANKRITIPSFNNPANNYLTAESLNIATATAIVCNEWRRG